MATALYVTQGERILAGPFVSVGEAFAWNRDERPGDRCCISRLPAPVCSCCEAVGTPGAPGAGGSPWICDECGGAS